MTQEQQDSIKATLQALFHDQKVWLSLATIISMIAVYLVPTLAGHADIIALVVILLGGGLVLHQSKEDLIGQQQNAPATLEAAITQIVAELFAALNQPKIDVTMTDSSGTIEKKQVTVSIPASEAFTGSGGKDLTPAA